MPVTKHEYPILEYDTGKVGVIKPNRKEHSQVPSKCLMTFFGEVLNTFIEKHSAVEVSHCSSEMHRFPIYEVEYKGEKTGVIQAVVGSASIAMMADLLIGYGTGSFDTDGRNGTLRR